MLNKKDKESLIQILDKYKDELNEKAYKEKNIFKFEQLLSVVSKIIYLKDKLYEPEIESEIKENYKIIDNILTLKQKYVIKHLKNPTIVVVPENFESNFQNVLGLNIIKSSEIKNNDEIIVL
jgi:hypothetical protein